MSLIKREELTQVQKALLGYWERCEVEEGKPPSITQVAKELGYTSRAPVHTLLQRLVRKGYMTKKQVKGRMGNVYSVVKS